jgi:thioesterase domain-containing protein
MHRLKLTALIQINFTHAERWRSSLRSLDVFPVEVRHHHIVMPDAINECGLALSPLDNKPALLIRTNGS